MEEKIEEELTKEYEFLQFKVKYIKIKTYKIVIDLPIVDKKEYKIIRTSFDYIWSDCSTFDVNISSIKYYTNKSILKMFIKGDENN